MTASKRTASALSSTRARVLEPRVLFDAAAVETVAVVSADLAEEASPLTDAAQLFAVPPTPQRNEAYFIDSAVAGYENLLAQVPAGAEVFLIDRDSSGLEQINTALAASGKTFDAIHIVSHGAAGALRIGSDVLTNDTLAANSDDLALLGSHLTSEGDLLLYGCDIAGSGDGAYFLANLATLTGADVAASTNATGGAGDGELEALAGTGTLTADVWSAVGLLDAPLALDGVFGGREDGDAGTPADQLGYAVDGSGEWIVAGGNGNGEVQAWKINGTTRDQQPITAPGALVTFGAGVAMDGNTLVVGEPGRGTRGWIYVYQLDASGSSWGLVRSIDISTVPGIGTASIGPWTDPNYGSTQWLAVSGNHIAVGIPNEGSGGGGGQIAWIAATSGSDWTSTLASGIFNEPAGADSSSHARFGASVALDEGLLVVGSPGYDRVDDSGLYGADTGSYGSVFVYNWAAGSTGGPTAGVAVTLVGQQDVNGVNGGDGVRDSRFGAAVDVEYFNGKYTIVAGAPGEGSGEVYIYQTSSADIGTIGAASNIYGQATAGDNYGLAVAVSQNRILVGAPNHTANTETGVWFYQTPGTWGGLDTDRPDLANIYVKTFTAASYSGGGGDKFGRGLAFIQGNIIAAGAPFYAADDRGAVAFYFARTPVAVNDIATIGENAGATAITVLSNDIIAGTENPATVPLTLLTATQTGDGIFSWDSTSRSFTFNPNGKYEYLALGDTSTATIRYTLAAQLGGVAFSTSATVTVTITGANDAPQPSAGLSNITVPRFNEPPVGPSAVSIGNIVIPTNTFFDVDIDKEELDLLAYSLVSVTPLGGAALAPPGFISVSGTYNNATGVNSGNIAYNLTGLAQNTSYEITIQASDGKGGIATTSFIFKVARDNQSPDLVPGGVLDFTDAVEDSDSFVKNLAVYFTDPDSPVSLEYPEVLTYSIVSQTGPGPSWLSISSSGSLSGAPSNDNVGVHAVKVRATDIFGNYVEDTFNVTVGNTNDAPVLTNDIDRKTAIRGETFSFNVTTGVVSWNGAAQPVGDTLPYFTDIDNSTADGRAPSSGDVITYRAYDALTGQEITSTAGSTNASWLRFNGTNFTGTPDSVLGKVITIRLDAIDRLGGAGGPVGGTTSTLFEIGVFPRDGSGAIGTGLPGIENGGRLGFDTAINSDSGRWMVVGEPGGNNGSGEIHIYENTTYLTPAAAPSWTFHASFTTAAVDARLGTSVDISADGTRIVAGAPLENGGQGAIYYFYLAGADTAADTNNSPWEPGHSGTTPVLKAVSPDAAAGDRFGSAVALNQNGTAVVVGAPQDDEAGTNAGAAYVFSWGAATGSGKRLPTVDYVGEAASTRAGDLYGSSVAFDQNMVVVGAPRDDHTSKADAGSAYVYGINTTTWANISFSKLKKADGIAQSDYFGTNVDVESFDGSNRVVVVVGTPNDDALANNAGAVYVYRSDGMTADIGNGDGALASLVLQSRITAYDGDALENFGYSVAVDVQGDTAAGALRIAVGGDLNGTSPGSAYAYRYYVVGGVSGWVGQRYQGSTDASTVSASNQYGFSVDIAGSRFVVGAPNADRIVTGVSTAAAGLYYSFNVATGSPIETAPASFSGAISKELGTGQPSPLMLGSQDSLFPATVGSLDQGHLEELLKPVQSWRLDEAAANQPLADTESRRPAGASLAEDLLFDLRTLKGKKLARLADPLDARLLEFEAAPQGEAPVEAPATEGAAPAAEGQEALPVAPVQEAAAMSQGFSLQLQAVQAARSRQQADRLLSSLSSLSA